ncbi:hypothetical protein DSO57_1023441 [Entomophthora muscae]|uniref:Uncharacterized protein n=1 Tax=Entomophthora muscae TaxID=34485 RepID=A0ACC2UNA6_9FUNG|nr:hypothetical protein DSO57_1023441 [Entomophthora muscae]
MSFFKVTTSLLRAREIYRYRNLLTGLSLMGFASGVFTYSMQVVKQDDFDDVPLPPTPTESPQSSSASGETQNSSSP